MTVLFPTVARRRWGPADHDQSGSGSSPARRIPRPRARSGRWPVPRRHARFGSRGRPRLFTSVDEHAGAGSLSASRAACGSAHRHEPRQRGRPLAQRPALVSIRVIVAEHDTLSLVTRETPRASHPGCPPRLVLAAGGSPDRAQRGDVRRCSRSGKQLPSGSREILAGGRYGSLVSVGDVDAVALAIRDGVAVGVRPAPPESWLEFELGTATDRFLGIAFDRPTTEGRRRDG